MCGGLHEQLPQRLQPLARRCRGESYTSLWRVRCPAEREGSMRKDREGVNRGEVFEIAELEGRDLTRVVAGLEAILIDDVNVSSGCTTNFGCLEGCANNCPPGCGN